MITKTEDLQTYLNDASNLSGGSAEKLFIPESAAEISEVLREAHSQNIPVTISGGRTGTVGGAIPFGGYVISPERLNKIKSIDRAAMTAVVEPGVILGDFQKAVEAENLFYPPDPTEWSCQIGGTVATNASGARTFKYGATRDYVKRLEVVLADGDVLTIERGTLQKPARSKGETPGMPQDARSKGEISLTTKNGNEITVKVPTYPRPKVRKNVSGYFNAQPLDAIDLFIGSEGTLGVITEVKLRLLQKPESFFSGIVFFHADDNLHGFVNEARANSFASRKHRQDNGGSLDASLLEYFDARSLNFIHEKFPETPTGMAGAIFFEQETTAGNEDMLLEKWYALLEKHDADIDRSWFTTTEADREKMRAFRHALPVAVNERIAHFGQRKLGTDMAVPDEKFVQFLRFKQEKLDSSGLDYVIFGHIGDCHLHANMLPKNEAEAEKARHLYGRFIAQAIMLGGTVSAEHGIGKLKRKYLNAMLDERYLNEMAALKRAFDPNGILGRGNMFDAKIVN